MPGISIPRPSLTPSFHSFLPLKVVGPQGDGIVFFFRAKRPGHQTLTGELHSQVCLQKRALVS